MISDEINQCSFYCVVESGKGKVGKDTFIEGIITLLPTLGAGESAFYVHFEWDESMGIPGAFYVKNFMQVEFFLKSLTLEDVPNHGTIRFVCNSWIYNTNLYKKSLRIFFANHVRSCLFTFLITPSMIRNSLVDFTLIKNYKTGLMYRRLMFQVRHQNRLCIIEKKN